MNYTENLSLGLPEYGEDADVADLNRNSGILDAYVYNTRQMECEPYDSTKTYMSGDLAIHNEVVYECNTDNTTGTWDDSKWDSTTLAEQIAKAKQMGGESALADLEDVEITNPSTGQALLFDDDDDVWKNQDLPDVSVTKEATGNPIELTDAASAPLVRCVTEIQGSQDLHGYDKPWVGGAGKNKLPTTLSNLKSMNTTGTWNGSTYSVNGVTISVITDSDDNVHGFTFGGGSATNEIYFNFYSGTPIANNSYIFSFGEIIISENYSGGLYASTAANRGGTRLFSAIRNGTQNINNEVGTVWLYIQGGGAISGTIYPMIRLSTESDSTFAPYSNICPITAYTEGEIEVRGKNVCNYNDSSTFNVYNGSVSIANYVISLAATGDDAYIGTYNTASPTNAFALSPCDVGETYKLIVSDNRFAKNYVTFYDSNNAKISAQRVNLNSFTVPSGASKMSFRIGYEYTVSGTTYKFTVMVLKATETDTTYEPYTSTTHTTTYPSAIYRGSEDCVNGEVVTEWGMIASYAGETLPGEWISDRDEYVPGTPPTTGAQVAYELATPTTTHVTPTNLPIRTLSGYNHIESSTGDMEIEYITEGYQPLVDLIQSSKHVYSTQEQIVGTWVDGSTLYERTIYISDTLAMESPNTWIDSGVDISYVDKFVSFNATMYDGSGVPALWCGKANNHLTLLSSRGNTFNGLCVVFRYTKSTTTRSLSAPVTSQKAQIEPLSDKEEEVPTEEEKAVNEEDNNDER